MVQLEELSASMEDYLQAIYHIQAEKQAARAKDIAMRLKVNNSSVTGALRALSKKGYINYAPYDVITLTEKGDIHAKDVVRRHEALRKFFTKVLYVDDAEAETTACKMEHEISRTVLDRMIRFVNFIQVCPRGGEEWIRGFWTHSKQAEPYERCDNCIAECQEHFEEARKAVGDMPRGGILLSKLKPGQRGKIMKIKGDAETRKRIEDMKIPLGAVIDVEAVDSSNNIIKVNVRGYHIALRNEDAENVSVSLYLG
ncbi:DtxR family transcriptional regulator [Desulfonema ishimotonii]|uniref:Transcriptional regulator MntR n=1 Tax=Desulfonema ishimotonii TaxID=45657 RepID=A0A401FVM8_9BACT|nr:metal-dependent transcriptional regulator [Desulfonema ishimotonii]GBC61026.1 DtxR family transcriptional regulator [Desulfonema ishimotonii]